MEHLDRQGADQLLGCRTRGLWAQRAAREPCNTAGTGNAGRHPPRRARELRRSGVLPSEGPAAGEVAGERDTAAAKRDLEQKVKAIDAWPMLSLPSAAPMIAELSDPASSLSIFSARALSSAAALSLIAASLYWVCCSSSARRLAISCCSVVWSAASCS